MAKYKDIGGTTVGFRSGSEEYTYPSGFEGSIYYNSGNGQFEFVGLGTGTWASGTSFNTGRTAHGSTGNTSNALIFGGSPPYTGITELWNGSSWTEVADLSQARYQCTPGIGKSTTSALCVGGLLNPGNQLFANNESWNGSTWTEVNDLNVAKRATAGQSGTGVSALCFGGLTATPAYVRTNEDWNGSSWVELADMSASGGSGGGGAAADSTAAVAFGGYVSPSYSASTEEWSSTSVTTKVLTD